MGPPTEQLIRDYLNRLSVAARDRLGPEDRRALLDRTRKVIERRADFAGRPKTIEVGRVLARLGDPAGLVEQEVRRLAAVRGVQQRPASAPAESGSRGFLAWVFRREPGTGWRGSADEVGQESPEITLLDSAGPAAAELDRAALAEPADGLADDQGGDAAPGRAWPARSAEAAGPAGPAEPSEPAGPAGPSESAVSAGPAEPGGPAEPTPADAPAPAAATGVLPAAAQPASANGVHNSTPGPAGTMPLKPQWPSVVARDGSQDYGNDRNTEAAPPVLNGRVVSSPMPDGAAAATKAAAARTDGTASTWQLETPATPGLIVVARRLLSGLASWVRRRPLEAAALALLGIGGVIYPPVFLLGAVVALGSRFWDYRDKWLGLVLPVLLALIGLVVGIAAGGRSHGLHEGWLYLNISSRVAAVLGAGYLTWRSVRGRRPPAVPPWNRPHRVG